MPCDEHLCLKLALRSLPGLRYIVIFNDRNDFGRDMALADESEQDFKMMMDGLLKGHPDAEILLFDCSEAWFRVMLSESHATWRDRVRRVPFSATWENEENSLEQLVRAYDAGDTSWIDTHWMIKS